MQKIKSKTAGFTLLELLVVISIIGILMALGVVAFSTAQSKGRDAKRRGDMQALQDAQEQYYAANGEYASSDSDLTSGEFINIVPNDPQEPNQSYNLDYESATEYCFCANIEEEEIGNSDNGSCSWAPGNDGSWYCVANLQ